MSDKIEQLINKSRDFDKLSFARLLTLVENQGVSCLEEELLLNPHKMALRVGITGPPGAGKSTLINSLIKELNKSHLRVGVLAVDPSSPFSHGAILGDRIRYTHSEGAKNLFIRSIGSRGSLGGLSGSAYLMLRAFDACHFDLVIIETVGVGQTELEVMNVSDLVTVVLVPESGDSIQAMKAGLMEIADIFVVNKMDRPGAASMVKEIENSMSFSSKSPKPRVISTQATESLGVDQLYQYLMSHFESDQLQKKRYDSDALKMEAAALLRFANESQIQKKVSNIKDIESFKKTVLI